MRIVRTLAELRAARRTLGTLAFVPTMGNLHAGHIALIELAQNHAAHVAASIFVNRLQFAPNEDFDRYPRTFQPDCEKLRAAGVDLLFAPDETELYPAPQSYVVDLPPMANELEGAFRPRFFHGVATVVLKLLNCMQPQIAVFGKKDYQQLMVIRGMVEQLNLPIDIIAAETVREADGLALSSRNNYLSTLERRHAPRLYAALRDIQEKICGGHRNFQGLGLDAMSTLGAAGWKPDYISIRRRADFAVPAPEDSELVVLGAARLGTTRLIDNLEI